MVIENTSTHGELVSLFDRNKVEYIADLSKDVKNKLENGEWKLGIRAKTGETYAVLKDCKIGRMQRFVDLKEKMKTEMGKLPQLAAIQYQLKELSEQIQTLNQALTRVEQGQYDNRYAGFISARQIVIRRNVRFI